MSDRLTGFVVSALPRVNESLAQYVQETGKSVHETLYRKGKDLQIRLYRGFRRLRPEKGEIRAEAERRGFRVRVRPSVAAAFAGKASVRRQGRVLNWRAQAVRRELAIRSSGSGFLSTAYMNREYRAGDQPRSARFASLTRRRKEVGSARIDLRQKNSSVRLIGEAPGMQLVGQSRGVVGAALKGMDQDTRNYLALKQGQRAGRVLRSRYRANKI